MMATDTDGSGGTGSIPGGSGLRRFLGYGCGVLLLVVATGCSGGGRAAAPRLPDPAAGKVAAFDLGPFSKDYDLDQAVRSAPLGTPVTSDRAGNVYMVAEDGGHVDVLRMTPKGAVSRYVRTNTTSTSMMVRKDGSVVLGAADGSPGSLPAFAGNGAEQDVTLPPSYTSPRPVGERPDGSLVVSEGANLWALRDGSQTRLYHQARTVGDAAVVDSSGTVYVVPQTLGDTMAVPSSGAPYPVEVTGKDPATGEPLSAFAPEDMAPATAGGFYVLATDKSLAEYVLLYVRKGATTVLVRQRTSDKSCAAGKQYPALDNTCEVQTGVVQSGPRVLLLGNLVSYGDGHPQPALAVKAPAS